MTRHEYTLVDVFTDTKFGGNQLAVFTDGRGITTETMQAVAKELAIAETTFVLPKEKDGDHKVRIFTPGKELPFAGHPTVGTTWVLSGGRDGTIKLELTVGTLAVTVKSGFVEMEQPLPVFGPELNVYDKVREAIGDVLWGSGPPFQVVSCGNAFLFAGIDGLDGMSEISVNPSALKSLLDEVGAMGLYAFTPQVTVRPDSTVHGRMFPIGVGYAEDPATGSAAGPLGAYLVRHEWQHVQPGTTIVCEQGFEMGRPSIMRVRIDGTRDNITGVHVGGNVANVGGGWMDL